MDILSFSRLLLAICCYAIILSALLLISLVLWAIGLQTAHVYFSPLPAHLPWAGLKDQRLSKLRATLRELSVKRTVIQAGYEKYSKHGKAFILPSLQWPVVVLPPSQTRWVVSQPEEILSTISVQDDLTGPQYFGHGPDSKACHDFGVITRDLTRNLGRLTGLLREEIAISCKRELGGADVVEVELASTLKKVASEAVTRAVVGKELAYDQRYLERLNHWGYGFGYCGMVFGLLCPRWLKPLAGRVLSLPVKILRWRVGRLVYPLIEKRQEEFNDSDEKGASNDLLQWVIESAGRDPDPRARNLNNILGRTMMYNMFAQHTTQSTAATVLFDLLSYPSGSEVLPALIEEANSVMSRLEADPYATRAMVKLDSAIRESMRLNPMFTKGIAKEVVKKGGVCTPDGFHLPEGCHISTASTGFMMRDEEFYDEAKEFKPLRFYDEAVKTGVKQKAASHVDETHACPGRFFGAHMLKLMLGHILSNYDFEPLKERPAFDTFGDLTMPPSTKVRVQRRHNE